MGDARGQREQLFEAADRVLERDGPSGLTSRAITSEAGCGRGVLHKRFDDLDRFLVEYALDRLARLIAGADGLLDRVGEGTVVDNLTDAAAGIFGSGAFAISALMFSRPYFLMRVEEVLEQNGAGFNHLEQAVAAYLDAEAKLGRVASGGDTEMVAFTLLGSVRHLFFTAGSEPVDRLQVRRIVTSLVAIPGGGPQNAIAGTVE
jgi:AcrR family transcriptional regulator